MRARTLALASALAASLLAVDARAQRPPLSPADLHGAPTVASGGELEQSDAPVDDVSPVIVQYRNALWRWFAPEERSRLDAIDASGTAGAEAHLLRFFAVDRALRRFAPMALDAVVRGREAVRLRALPPVVDERSASVAARSPVVLAAVRRRDHVANASAEALARALIEHGPALSREGAPGLAPQSAERLLAADRAVLAAADAAHFRDVGDVAEAALAAATAYGTDVDRAAVVDACVDLLRELVTVARESPPVTAPSGYLPPAVDPLAEALAEPPARAGRGRRARAGLRAAAPTPACVEEFTCLPP
jgi:hypothetical protein